MKRGDNTTSMSTAGHGFKCGKTLTLFNPGTWACPYAVKGKPLYDSFCPSTARIRGGDGGWVLHDAGRCGPPSGNSLGRRRAASHDD